MTLSISKTTALVPVFVLVALGCSVRDSSQVTRADFIADGVYPVVHREHAATVTPNLGEATHVVELDVLPVRDEAPDTLWITTELLLRFESVSYHEFQFDKDGECATVVLENTERLKAYSRDHVGSRLAVVIRGMVVTHHKIRVPLETDEVNITFCTKGAGDHLMKHLKGVLPASTR